MNDLFFKHKFRLCLNPIRFGIVTFAMLSGVTQSQSRSRHRGNLPHDTDAPAVLS